MDPASTLASARTLASQGLHRSVQLLVGGCACSQHGVLQLLQWRTLNVRCCVGQAGLLLSTELSQRHERKNAKRLHCMRSPLPKEENTVDPWYIASSACTCLPSHSKLPTLDRNTMSERWICFTRTFQPRTDWNQLEIKVLGGYANACIRTGELYKAKGSVCHPAELSCISAHRMLTSVTHIARVSGRASS
ncbi:hypothetical protein BC831DRAFT_136224 [Entophlyctis helioformis]|nr:hypothetical protein BC831DRAFT_136224 [Entophlyctis helioformis]